MQIPKAPRILLRLREIVRSRLLYKMLIIYSLLTLVPLIVVSTTFFVRTGKLIERKATEEAQRTLADTANSIDDKLYQIKKLLMNISEFAPAQKLLSADADALQHRGPPLAENERDRLESTVTDWLDTELASSKQRVGEYISGYTLLNLAGGTYFAGDGETLAHPQAYSLLPFEFPRVPEWAFFTDRGRMMCVMNLYAENGNETTDRLIGILIVSLDPAKAAQLYGNYEAGKFLLTNSDNLIVSATDASQIGKVLDVRQRDLIQLSQKSRYSDFVYVDLIKSGTGGVIRKQAFYVSLITLIAWLVVFLVTYGILRRVTIPLQRLTRLMRKAEQEQYFQIDEVTTSDEVAVLCHGYNQMVRRTKELIDTNYKNELLKKEAELKAIRMYINPHFLYNTLEYASIMSQSPRKAEFVPDILHKLSGIFRFSIMPGGTFIPLETELTFAETYLNIHSYRYGERLNYEIELPDMLRRVAVPKLILQPLVENAIIHGIDRLESGGKIRIRAMESQYQLLIEIENSCPPQEDSEGKKESSTGLGSGLENVDSRIRHHFGGAYGVTLQRQGDSATVKVSLPIQLFEEGVAG